MMTLLLLELEEENQQQEYYVTKSVGRTAYDGREARFSLQFSY